MSHITLGETNPTTQNPPCCQRIMESKWVDTALVVGIAALLTIAVIASVGGFNFIGTANATYLSYGAYAGSALLIIAEVLKLALTSPWVEKVNQVTSKSVKSTGPLTRKEIESLKRQAAEHAASHAHTFSGETKGEAVRNLLSYMLKIINKSDFQNNPVGYMVAWAKQRGSTEELRYPEDTARAFFIKAVGQIRTLPKRATY